MDNNTQQGEIYSFWQLLQKKRIEIPIIQRDYAQGREDKKEIRTEFLNALYKSLNEEEPIRLDFIYGSSLGDIFQPLDGQQRLSTLFLLHWYASAKEKVLSAEIQDILTKFSYETRASSREFCTNLVRGSTYIDFSSEKISPYIIDSSWFFLLWKKDPTIDAMLRAIDDIHAIFKDMDRLWDRIISDAKLISFYYVILDNFGLTDDLYIKMNARGKLLTPFENFKAKFQARIQENSWGASQEFSNSFASKIDTRWTELFWKHRKMNRIDDAFIRFISTIAMIHIALEKSDDRIAKIAKLQRQPDLVRAEDFTQEGYNYLYSCLEIYCQVYDDTSISLELGFPLWQHEPEENIFTALVYEGNNASYTQKVLFYAQTEYLLKVSEFNENKLRDWMRVIRNIISRGDVAKTGKRPAIIRSPESFDSVIGLINELAEGCEDIYRFLSANSIGSSFAKEQIEEERKKSRLITKNDAYKKILFSVEDTNFLRGKIDFALYCIDYEEEKNNFDDEKLKGIQIVIKKYLEEEITDDLRRGLLTISADDGAYDYYGYWWSWVYAVDATKRCLIARYRQLEYFIYGSYKSRDGKPRDYYKQYLKKLLLQLTESSLEEVIRNFIPPDGMPNWKIRLIKDPQLLERCESKYIAIPEDESCCYLLKSMRPREKEDCEKIE
jgi:hypothetical protein